MTETWMRRLQRLAYFASVEIAKEKGPFPLFDAEPFLAGETVAALDADLKAAIGQHGILEAGAHFIQKPFSSDDLLRKVRAVLEGS